MTRGLGGTQLSGWPRRTRQRNGRFACFVSLGADVNAKNRFGELMITDAIAGGNLFAYRAMLDAEADLDAQNNGVVTILIKNKMSPAKNKVFSGERLEKMLSGEMCATCWKKGVSNYCSYCASYRKVYYCLLSCQLKDWKQNLETKCGKEEADARDEAKDARAGVYGGCCIAG